MSVMALSHPVFTLDNQQLLPAGSVLSKETMSALISSNKTSSYQTISLLKHCSVKEDLLEILHSPHYKIIFSDQRQISNLLSIMESVRFLLPVLHTLDYFKEHDFYTYRHILTVFALSTLLAEELISDYHEKIKGVIAGPYHDVGKICVPLHILKKSDPLTQSELNVLKHHSVAGYILLSYYLKETQSLSAIVARDHHERRDGSGYPRGIMLRDNIVEIIAVSDIYDALISSRPYRPVAYDNRLAIEEITEMAKKNKVSWNIVKVLVAHNRKDKPHYSDCTVSTTKRGTSPSNNVYGIIIDKEKSAAKLNTRVESTKKPSEKTLHMGIKKQYLKALPVCKVTFRLPSEAAPEARTVMIVGDFNNWNRSETPLKRLKDGNFTVTLELPCNREYRFRYLIDSNLWENDWCADKYIPNAYGSDDSVVIV